MRGFIASLILSWINENMEAFRISGFLFFNFNIKVGIKDSILHNLPTNLIASI